MQIFGHKYKSLKVQGKKTNKKKKGEQLKVNRGNTNDV